jgi:hypothetical protein
MATELLPRELGKRKTASVVIDADNRDKGKRFLLTEMPAAHFERWVFQVVAKLAREGMNVPAGIRDMGAAAITYLPFSWVDDAALVDQLLTCVQAWPEGSPIARTRVTSDTEEWTTLTQLRMEVIALHVNFSLAAALWKHLPALAVALQIPADTSPAPTSPGTSPLS